MLFFKSSRSLAVSIRRGCGESDWETLLRMSDSDVAADALVTVVSATMRIENDKLKRFMGSIITRQTMHRQPTRLTTVAAGVRQGAVASRWLFLRPRDTPV